MTNCTRSTMNWHNYLKDFLWIESNSELRARLIGSIIFGDRGSACWAISVINSALGILQLNLPCSIQFLFHYSPIKNTPFCLPLPFRAFSLVAKKKIWKKKTQIFSHCSKRNRVVGTGGGRVEVRQGVGVVGFENPISTQISSEIAKQSVCWCAYATILYYLIHIRV